MKFKIELPERKEDKDKEALNKKMFSDDFEKGNGLLSKVLVFIEMYDVVSVTELTDLLIEYYKVYYNRANIFRACERLQKLDILNQTTSGVVLIMAESEKEPIHNHIVAKHKKFLNNIPAPFKHRYNDVNYFWISNGEGKKYVEWCCKLLGFKCEKQKEE